LDPDVIQFRDLSRMDSPEITAVAYPAYQGGVVLGPTHLFWHADPVRAKAIDALGRSDWVQVSSIGMAVAATRKHVFLETFEPDLETEIPKGRILAKSIDRLSDPSPEAIQPIAHYHFHPLISRHLAASEEYFV